MARNLAATDQAAVGQTRLPMMMKVTLLVLCCPALLSIGGTLLTPSRALFVVLLPFLIIRLFTGAYGRVVLSDVLMLFYAFWMSISIALNNSSVVVSFAGLQVTTLLGGYFVSRATIRNVAQFQAFTRFFAGLVIFMLPLALYESITGHYVIPALIKTIPGLSSIPEIDYERRLGLDRAQVVFPHPIHFGLVCSMALSLYFVGLTNQVSFFKRTIVACLILGSVFLSVSSGPFLAALFQGGLICYMLMTRSNKAQWSMLLWSVVIVYAILEVITTKFALYVIATKLAFNSATANIRAILFDYGSQQVARTPLFGVGFNYWPRPPYMSGSIDNYWLQVALTFGLPCLMAIAGVFLYSMIYAGRGKLVRGSDAYYMRVGWTFVLVSLSLSLATVTIWSEALSIVMLVVGAGGFLMSRDGVDEVCPEAVVAAIKSQQPLYTRFSGERTGHPRTATDFSRRKISERKV